jgi:hypothetical protein
MRASVQARYGRLEASELSEIDHPVPTDDEVLQRMRAAGLDRECGMSWQASPRAPLMIKVVTKETKGRRRRTVPIIDPLRPTSSG